MSPAVQFTFLFNFFSIFVSLKYDRKFSPSLSVIYIICVIPLVWKYSNLTLAKYKVTSPGSRSIKKEISEHKIIKAVFVSSIFLRCYFTFVISSTKTGQMTSLSRRGFCKQIYRKENKQNFVSREGKK